MVTGMNKVLSSGSSVSGEYQDADGNTRDKATDQIIKIAD